MNQRDTYIAKSFNKQIGKIIDYKLRNITTVESAIVVSLNADNTVNLQIPPDTAIYTHVQNQSIYQDLNVGDCVKVIKQNNRSSNMWIIGGHNLKNTQNYTKNDMINMIYPIGSVYISINNINPSMLFGGTWVQIKDTFLLAAGDTYAAGDTGGEVEHTLTYNEMPSHRHNGSDNYIDYAAMGGTSNNRSVLCHSGGHKINFPVTDYAGDGQPHNNMPPYLAVYMWKRTA